MFTENIHQAFENMPYLFSLNKKKKPLFQNLVLPNHKISNLLLQKIIKIQDDDEESSEESIIENKSTHFSKINNSPSYKSLSPRIYYPQLYKINIYSYEFNI